MENERLPAHVDRKVWRRFVRRHTRRGLIPIDVHLSYGGTNALAWKELLKRARRWQDALLKSEDKYGFRRAYMRERPNESILPTVAPYTNGGGCHWLQPKPPQAFP